MQGQRVRGGKRRGRNGRPPNGEGAILTSPLHVSSYWHVVLFLNRIVYTQCVRCGLLLQMSHVAWSVLVIPVYCTKNGGTDRDAVWGWLMWAQETMY